MSQAEQVSLKIPSTPEWVYMARLTIGGLSQKLNFRVDETEDLKIAVEQLILQAAAAEELELRFQILPDALRVSIGPLKAEVLKDALDHEHRNPDRFHIRQLMEVLVDAFGLEESTEAGLRVRLQKLIR